MAAPDFKGEMNETAKKRGRPRKEFTPKQVENLARIQCTNEEIAAGLGISVDTLARRLEDPIFADAIKRGRDVGKSSLRRAQVKAAINGNPAMLIWLGKQYLGQSDKVDIALKDKRERAEIAIKEVMEQAKVEREEAVQLLRSHIPMISELVN